MLCFEVSVNGEPLTTMGHEELATMSLTLDYVPEVARVELSSFGGLRKVTSPEDLVSWFKPVSQIEVGDEVSIRVVDSAQADNPVKPRLAKDAPQHTLYCAFCGSPQSEDRRMVVGTLCICESCVAGFQDALAKG